jgi:hypothetical protein
MTEKMTMDKWDVGGLPHQNEYLYYNATWLRALRVSGLRVNLRMPSTEIRHATNDERDDTMGW